MDTQYGVPHIYKKKAITVDVLTLAVERIRHAFTLFDHITVSFSGGKDSTVCLNLTLDVAKELGRVPLDVIFYDEEAIPYETEDYVRRVSTDPNISLRWFCLPISHRNACSRKTPYWYPWDPDCQELWTRPCPPEGIRTFPGFQKGWSIPTIGGIILRPDKVGTVGQIMGIRADESLTRYAAVSRKKRENYIIKDIGVKLGGKKVLVGGPKGGIFKVYPIYDWTTKDVWTAPNKFSWDYNRAYDLMDQAGIAPSSQRCAPPYGEQPMQNLWMYKVCFPTLWEKMCNRVPGAATAARYAHTTLFGFKDRESKPPGMSWPEFLSHYLDKYDPIGKRVNAAMIGKWLRLHYKATHDPILVKAPHPDTGVSWDMLLKIAMRGDFKNRENAAYSVGDKRKAWERYNQELQTSLLQPSNG